MVRSKNKNRHGNPKQSAGGFASSHAALNRSGLLAPSSGQIGQLGALNASFERPSKAHGAATAAQARAARGGGKRQRGGGGGVSGGGISKQGKKRSKGGTQSGPSRQGVDPRKAIKQACALDDVRGLLSSALLPQALASTPDLAPSGKRHKLEELTGQVVGVLASHGKLAEAAALLREPGVRIGAGRLKDALLAVPQARAPSPHPTAARVTGDGPLWRGALSPDPRPRVTSPPARPRRRRPRPSRRRRPRPLCARRRRRWRARPSWHDSAAAVRTAPGRPREPRTSSSLPRTVQADSPAPGLLVPAQAASGSAMAAAAPCQLLAPPLLAPPLLTRPRGPWRGSAAGAAGGGGGSLGAGATSP